MTELEEYRENLLQRFETAVKEFRRACEAFADPQRPLGAGEWSVHQIAVHTRDTDREVYGLRMRRTLEEENPLFVNFDGEAWMASQYDAKEPLQQILSELAESVREQVQRLRAVPREVWSRPSRHETLGKGFTTQTWVERNLTHIEEHLVTLRAAQAKARA